MFQKYPLCAEKEVVGGWQTYFKLEGKKKEKKNEERKKNSWDSEEGENNLFLTGFSFKYLCPLGMQYSLRLNFFQLSLRFWEPHFSPANIVQLVYYILWVTGFQRNVGVKDHTTTNLSYME